MKLRRGYGDEDLGRVRDGEGVWMWVSILYECMIFLENKFKIIYDKRKIYMMKEKYICKISK